MKFIDINGKALTVKPIFSEQIHEKNIAVQYDAGVVSECDGDLIIAYEMKGAEETFSIGQPVYDKDGNIMGWLGIGLYEGLNYAADVRIPCEYWRICLPTKHCARGKKVYTYWQMLEKNREAKDD